MLRLLKRLGQRKSVRRRDAASTWKERRALFKKSGLFDKEWYLRRNEDIRVAGLNPLDHFARHGAQEWRDPGPGFDSAFYADRNPSFAETGLSPFEHYLRIGHAAGNPPIDASPYERWVQRFDTLSDQDRDRIASEVEAAPLPEVVWLQVPGRGDSSEEALHEADRPVGVTPRRRVVARQDTLFDATRAEADLPDGAVVILTAGGAVLRPHSAYAFAMALVRDGAEAAYSDHDHVDRDGQRRHPVFKPAMSPDFMAHTPYAGPVVALRIGGGNRARIVEALRMALEADPATAFARLLLATDRRRVTRVPLCLYSLPQGGGASGPDGQELLEVVPGGTDTSPAPTLAEWPQVSIVIPTRDRRELLEPCIASIVARTDYPRDRFRIVVVDNDTREPRSVAYLRDLAEDPLCAVVSSPGPFNFSKICNDGAAASDGEVIVFLNNDITVIAADWLKVLAAHAIKPDVGAVGAKLLYPDDTIQHGGVVLGVQGVGAHRLVRRPVAETTALDATREMTAVTGACLAMRRTAFDAVGGFDTVLAVAFNDAQLCMRLFQAGYRNIYVSQALLYHHESKSRGLDDSPEKQAVNRREAIYVRSRFGDFFRDDPSYNPNLSLQKIGDLAFPPRVVRPWRRSATHRRVLILSSGHGLGHGVGCVVAQQAIQFQKRGWEVTVGGPVGKSDRDYPGCKRTSLVNEAQAASYAVSEGYDCVIAHTPPFFSVARYLGRRPLFYIYDHGEPPPALFEDSRARETIDWEKRFCAPLAHRVFAISQAIFDEQYRTDALVLRNGNTHLSSWSRDWAEKRRDVRRRHDFEGRYVVLNVCRFHAAERRYKGVDHYAALAAEVRYAVPALANEAVFVLAGRGDEVDVAHLRKAGLTVFPNISDTEMAELYAASDLYVSLSQWEGYNLGIGQALAMGLDAIASDIPAHREFNIPTANALPKLCALVGDAYGRWDEAAAGRTARLESWDQPLSRLVDIIEDDVATDAARSWL